MIFVFCLVCRDSLLYLYLVIYIYVPKRDGCIGTSRWYTRKRKHANRCVGFVGFACPTTWYYSRSTVYTRELFTGWLFWKKKKINIIKIEVNYTLRVSKNVERRWVESQTTFSLWIEFDVFFGMFELSSICFQCVLKTS